MWASAIPMTRIAAANLPFPRSREEAVASAQAAIAEAGTLGVDALCFPECFVPGYRTRTNAIVPPDASFLEHAWQSVAAAAARADVSVILGTERLVGDGLFISALVVARDGRRLGFQDKVQLDPSEEWIYSAGTQRHVFTDGELTFGVSICHEGWRYPETVRWAARRGAQVVFHPHYHWAEYGGYRPTSFADPKNTFHEKALLSRAAENTCFIASVNYAGEGSPTTSAIVRPDGTVLAWQPYGVAGLLVADIDL
jgi:predicted amidohydrolase